MRVRSVNAFGAALAAGLCVGGPLRAEPSELPPELGYNHSELELPRTAALGGATRALGNSLDALQVNPANLVATRVYHIGGHAQFWTGASRQSYGASIVDSVVSRSRLAGGVSGTWSSQDPDGLDRDALDVRFGLAFPVSDALLVGASARYLDLSQEGYARGRRVLAPSVAARGLDGESIVKDITFDAGISIRPAPGLALGLVGQNLTNPGHGLLPLLFGGGVGYGTSLFTIEADVVGDFTTYESTAWRGMGGLELLAAGQYPLRVGYRYDDGPGSHAVSGGVGYAAREFSFDLSVRRGLGEDGYSAFFIGLKYHVESVGNLASPD